MPEQGSKVVKHPVYRIYGKCCHHAVYRLAAEFIGQLKLMPIGPIRGKLTGRYSSSTLTGVACGWCGGGRRPVWFPSLSVIWREGGSDA